MMTCYMIFKLNYLTFNAATTLSLDILQAGYTPESRPNKRQTTRPRVSTVKLSDRCKSGVKPD